MFGALYLIDYMFFENEGEGKVDLVNQECSFKCCDLYCCGCILPCHCNCGGGGGDDDGFDGGEGGDDGDDGDDDGAWGGDDDGGDDDGGGDGDDGGSGVVDDDDQDHDVSDGGEVDINDAIPILEKFCMNELSPRQIQGIFQLPRSELTEVLNSKYKICSAFAVVFCTVVEQVANFKVTGYPTDARSNSNGDNSEEIFEQNLKFKKVGRGFCVDIITSSGTINEKVLRMFLQRMVGLAGPTLLARAAKSSSSSSTSEGGGGGSGSDDDDGDVDGASSEVIESRGPSFRSDRRVVRLMIARYWADRLIEKYEEVKKMKDEANLRTIENAQVQ
mmetsp:Transcript_27968/g.45400  ORF Transcript_27968/g.45400 Transcript_27968/m.45400 type:complete len:331 (-) Transcript_27968:85-1077(-)